MKLFLKTKINLKGVVMPFLLLLFGGNLHAQVLVSCRVLLQGAMSSTGTGMTTRLNDLNLIPKPHPYIGTPFNYAGAESVASIPAGVTDWVLLELRDATTPATVVATRAAFVMSDGTVVDLDGVSPVSFATVAPDNYYIAVRHRNHLGVRSAKPLALSGTVTLYDFTGAQDQAYQNPGITTNAAMADLGNGLYAMWGGDGNSNGVVRYNGFGNDEAILTGALIANGGSLTAAINNVYSPVDFNLNGKISYAGLGNDEAILTGILSNNVSGVLSVPISQHF